MHKDKPMKAMVRKMMELDIHHPENVIRLNKQINHAAHKLITDNNKENYRKLIKLTDEIAVLADSVICAPRFAAVRASQQFTEKQTQLLELYQIMFCKK